MPHRHTRLNDCTNNYNYYNYSPSCKVGTRNHCRITLPFIQCKVDDDDDDDDDDDNDDGDDDDGNGNVPP